MNFFFLFYFISFIRSPCVWYGNNVRKIRHDVWGSEEDTIQDTKKALLTQTQYSTHKHEEKDEWYEITFQDCSFCVCVWTSKFSHTNAQHKFFIRVDDVHILIQCVLCARLTKKHDIWDDLTWILHVPSYHISRYSFHCTISSTLWIYTDKLL